MDSLDMGRCFAVLHRRSQFFIAEACESLGITYLEYVALTHLYREEGISQEELAASLYLDKAIVARTVGLLEKKEWVRREKDPVDRRMKRVYLTELAIGQKDYLLGVLQAWINYLMEGMTPEEAEASTRGFRRLAGRAARANIAELTRSVEEKARSKQTEGK